jgi:phage terminase large subunit-like protein
VTALPDPAAFCAALIDPETGRPFVLTPAERLFLDHAFALADDGRLRYPEMLWSAPKKSGKTAFAAMLLLYVVRVLGGRFAEGYCCANDFEQSQGRVFAAAGRIAAASPLLASDAAITANKIEFPSTGAAITALASDYAGAAGTNPTITVFDELWAYTSERAHRLWDEMIPPPTRKIACRLTVTYAGFSGESELLESLYKRGVAGERIAPDLYAAGGLLMYWTNEFTAPWQTAAWREQMREQHRPNAYLRQIENRWVTSESPFIDLAWWDECTDPAVAPVIASPETPVWLGVDASVKRDSTAIAAAAWDDRAGKVRLVFHRVWQPSVAEPLDFEATIEATLIDLSRRFRIVECRYDPYQMQASAQRLLKHRVPMVEFPQTSANLTEASSNLYELVKGRNLVVYPDDAVRLAVQRSVAVETGRGWRIAKERASHKIDVVVALAQAALGAVRSVTAPAQMWERGALLVDDGPVPLPLRASGLFATMALDERGAGVCYWAEATRHHGWPAVLLDYDLAPLSPGLFQAIARRFEELFPDCGGRGERGAAGPWLIAGTPLVQSARAAGIDAIDADRRMFEDRPALLAAAAAFVGGGSVKIGPAAVERSRYAPPLADLRPDTPPSALVDAALIGVAVSLPGALRVWERLAPPIVRPQRQNNR